MEKIQKINFPYFLSHNKKLLSQKNKVAVFFGCDFYNLPTDSNRELFIELENKIFDYMRKNLPGYEFIYQEHPNETDESKHLNLEGFRIGERNVAEVFLYDNADNIEYVFSAMSGASISAYVMGFNTYIFLDLCKGVLSDETLIGYRSYFEDLPEEFFIRSFDEPLPKRPLPPYEAERKGMDNIEALINPEKPIWFLAADPSVGLRAAILAKHLKQKFPNLKARLLTINHRRWNVIKNSRTIKEAFDEIVPLPCPRIWFSGSPKKIWEAIKASFALRKLPIEKGDNFISFNHAQFEENAILSYYDLNKILIIDNRWYKFIYEGGYELLPKNEFRDLWGVRIFNFFVEPVLGLMRTVYKEHKDGKVLNILRFRKDLDKVYNNVLVTKNN